MSNPETKSSSGQRWPEWHPQLAPFTASDTGRAFWQIFNTLIPYVMLWCLAVMGIQAGLSWLLIVPVLILAAAFLVRIFILFHDCVHGSFFANKRANTFLGYVLGLLVFTSFEDWKFTHLRHHGTYANLDARGFGDIWTMTAAEYKASSFWKRLGYRLYRSPFVLFGFGALFNFLLHNRLPDHRGRRKEFMSVILTNLLIVAVAIAVSSFIGWRTYLVVQIAILWMAGAMGVWLFYVQHQFPGGYWARKKDWDPIKAAIRGSSFYHLPVVLDWLSGHIGYHHIHHLNPRIPNYHLRKCYKSVSALQKRQPLGLLESFSCVRVKLWDEAAGHPVDFKFRPILPG